MIGIPLPYQYFTTLRSDELPAGSADLLRQRGRGYSSQLLGGGATTIQHGLPAVATRWDTGVEIHSAVGRVDLMGAVTNGTLSSPELRDRNGRRQLSGRISLRPTFGSTIGVSAARGAYLDRAVEPWLPPGRSIGDYRQRAYGIDAEFAAGHFLTRGEMLWSRWDVVGFAAPLGLTGATLEGQYKIVPGWYVAARADAMTFSRIPSPTGRQHWDAPLWRVELGVGYYPARHVLVKGSYQIDRRDGLARFNRDTLVAAQLAVRF